MFDACGCGQAWVWRLNVFGGGPVVWGVCLKYCFGGFESVWYGTVRIEEHGESYLLLGCVLTLSAAGHHSLTTCLDFEQNIHIQWSKLTSEKRIELENSNAKPIAPACHKDLKTIVATLLHMPVTIFS